MVSFFRRTSENGVYNQVARTKTSREGLDLILGTPKTPRYRILLNLLRYSSKTSRGDEYSQIACIMSSLTTICHDPVTDHLQIFFYPKPSTIAESLNTNTTCCNYTLSWRYFFV